MEGVMVEGVTVEGVGHSSGVGICQSTYQFSLTLACAS